MNHKNRKRLIAFSAALAMACAGSRAMAVDTVESNPSTSPATPLQEGPANANSKKVEFENASIKMTVIPRTREQMKAFYEGRGFPSEAIAAIAEVCYMTVIIKNKTDNILWLELDNWHFSSKAADIKRFDRDYWRQRWETLNIPMAYRSTFGWTLLPEQRDLRADESVGGNITLAFTEQVFQLTAKFLAGEDKQSHPQSVNLTRLQCIQ